VQRIYVVTHPEAEHHVEGLVGGWYDSSLTSAGRKAAEAIGRTLESELAGGQVHVYSSDLTRTMQTAEAIAERFGESVRPLRGLRELSYGDAEGKPQAWLDARFVPAPDDDRLDHVACPGGESKRVFATRVVQAFDTIVQDPRETKIVVTHGYAMTFIVATWIRMPIDAMGYINVRASSGGITLLQEDNFLRNRQLVYVNRTAHLEEEHGRA